MQHDISFRGCAPFTFGKTPGDARTDPTEKMDLSQVLPKEATNLGSVREGGSTANQDASGLNEALLPQLHQCMVYFTLFYLYEFWFICMVFM